MEARDQRRQNAPRTDLAHEMADKSRRFIGTSDLRVSLGTGGAPGTSAAGGILHLGHEVGPSRDASHKIALALLEIWRTRWPFVWEGCRTPSKHRSHG